MILCTKSTQKVFVSFFCVNFSIMTRTESFNLNYSKSEPQGHGDNKIKEFVIGFKHGYVALAKEPSVFITDAAARLTWTELDKRKVFLGTIFSRNFQKEYKEVH